HDETNGVGGVDDVALVDLTQARAAREWRHDLGVAQRRRRIVDRGLVGLDQRLGLRDRGALGVGLLLGAGIGGGELLVARKVNALVGELGLVLRLLGNRLVIRRLVERGMDL